MFGVKLGVTIYCQTVLFTCAIRNMSSHMSYELEGSSCIKNLGEAVIQLC